MIRSATRLILRALAHGLLLDEREGVLLGHAVLVHQHALGPVDDLARLELLLEVVDLVGQRLQLARSGRCATSMAGTRSLFWNGFTR